VRTRGACDRRLDFPCVAGGVAPDVLGRSSHPDGIAYDPVERHVFVSDESGGIEAVFDRTGKRIATIGVGGDVGNVQYDPGSGHVLVAVQSRNDLAVIDPRSNRIVRRVALAGCQHPHGLLIDTPRRVAYVACDGNATLLALDLRRMEVTGKAAVGGSPDVLAFDTSLRRLYVAAESGEVAVFAAGTRGLTKLGQQFLAPRAHTVAVDSRTHLVYFWVSAETPVTAKFTAAIFAT
jgi:DNA-binding beta-propeller fold protein YncE